MNDFEKGSVSLERGCQRLIIAPNGSPDALKHKPSDRIEFATHALFPPGPSSMHLGLTVWDASIVRAKCFPVSNREAMALLHRAVHPPYHNRKAFHSCGAIGSSDRIALSQTV